MSKVISPKMGYLTRFSLISYAGKSYLISWIMFGEAGLLMICSGLTIPRRSFVAAQRIRKKNVDYRRQSLKFAFAHSLTYFISSICLAIISTMAYYII